jgi:hypothetical protein
VVYALTSFRPEREKSTRLRKATLSQYLLGLPAEMHREALERAHSEDRPLAQVLRALLREWLAGERGTGSGGSYSGSSGGGQ